MPKSLSIKILLISLLMLGGTRSGFAAQEAPRSASSAVPESIFVAASEPYALTQNVSTPDVSPTAQLAYQPPLWSGSNAHMYLGLATIAAAVATAVTAPGSCDQGCPNPPPPRDVSGTHAQLAKATVGLAVATIATGLLVHWDDFYLADGITDPDNLHVLLGVSGAALMAYAVNKSLNSPVKVSHAGVAELGAAVMLVGIKLTW